MAAFHGNPVSHIQNLMAVSDPNIYRLQRPIPFPNRIFSGLSLSMDQPAASPAFPRPVRPNFPPLTGVASWSPHGRLGVASLLGFPCLASADPRRHCELRRRNSATPSYAAHAHIRPRARFGVTSPAAFAKGAPADRGSDAVGLPSETVGEGNMPFLMPGLDGEKLFTGRALARFGSACSFWGSRPVDLSPSDFVPRAPNRRAGFEPSWRGPSPALRGT